jgi:NADH-quinone oxidoreductase subunit E
MLRRLYHDQPEAFAFTPENRAWADAQITKYPEGREASAVIPLLWRAQEQEGWLSRPAIEHVADMLGLAHIRALEVATFYFMFQLQPIGSVAHIQICGTTSCMICGSEDLVAVCKDRIAPKAHQLSADGKFSWEEVECLGSCANAPMAQIGKDYFEDLTAESFGKLLDDMAAGKVPLPGPQNGRYGAEPKSGLTSLKDHEAGKDGYNASVRLAVDHGETIKRIDGTEVPLLAPWGDQGGRAATTDAPAKPAKSTPKTAATTEKARAAEPEIAPVAEEKPEPANVAPAAKVPASSTSGDERVPGSLDAPEGGIADDLKRISGVGPKLEQTLNGLGIYHFAQVAAWGPDDIARVDEKLTFKGRIERDDWVSQAAALAAES